MDTAAALPLSLAPALAELLAGAGLPPEAVRQAAFTGDEAVYGSPLRFGAAAAVALAATGIAANALRAAPRPVAVDLGAAAIATQSFRHLVLDGVPVASPRDALTGFYPCGDGQAVFLHLNFAHHRAAAAAVLGTVASREAMTEVLRGRQAGTLADAIVAAGGVAVRVAGRAEWEASPQGRALAALPPVEILPLADGPPRPLPAGAGTGALLAGLRVVDMTRVLAGPVCGRTLAEAGATVTRIQHPQLADLLPYQLDTGRDKAERRLDLRAADDRAALHGLLAGADVFLQSYRAGVAESFGLAPRDLLAAHPAPDGLVYTTLSAYGASGPWAGRRGFDSSVQAAVGIAVAEGRGAAPRLLPTSPLDYVSGWLLAFGTLVALHRRATEGGSWMVRGSLAQTAQWIAGFGTAPAAGSAEEIGARVAGLVQRHSTDSTLPAGRLVHLAPPLRLA